MKQLICLLLSGLLISSVGWAQSFRFRGIVEAAQQSGFHRILLPPGVVGHLNDNLTDVRLYDGQQHEVPYVLIRQQATQSTPFVDYEVVSKQSRPNAATTLIARNPLKNRINSLGIVIKNTNVRKKARLSGSSDAKSWYAIDDAIWLEPTQTTQSTTETKLLHFPLSDYEYYRLDIDDSLSTPLNILRVGHYMPISSAGAYTTIPNLTMSQRDSSDKHTYVHLTRPDNARFDKLSLIVHAALPFNRQADVGYFQTVKMKRGRKVRRFAVVQSFELSSTDSNVVYLPGLTTNDLYVVIANDDNPPLVVQNARAYQLTTYLLANLAAGQTYQLRFSAIDVAAPTYDLTPFKANLLSNPPVIGVTNITTTQAATVANASLFTDSWIIWPALGLVLLVLGFLSYRMIQDMGKSGNL